MKTVLLGDVCEKIRNIAWKSTTESFQYIDLTSVSRVTCSITQTTEINAKNAPSRAKQTVKAGDIIFATTRPTLKRVTLITEQFDNQICSTGFAVLRPKQNEVLSKYIFYYFLSDAFMDRMESIQRGTSYPAVTDTNVKSTQIPLLPIQEQRRVVGRLDAAFAKIERAKENTEKNLRNTQELFDVTFSSYFSGNENYNSVNLSEVCEINSKLIDPRDSRFIDKYHVGAGNIKTANGQLVRLKTAKQEKLISGKFEFDSNTVLYSKIRPYLKKVVRPDFEGICSADIYPLTPFLHKLARDYLYYLLLSPSFTDYAILGSARAGMPKVNRNHLFAYKFNLPTVEEQNETVKKLNNLSNQTMKLQKLYQQKLDDLDELKQSLLKQAFEGKL